MNDFHWKLIKRIVDSLHKPPNRKALLFTKDWIAFTEKLPSFTSSDKTTVSSLPTTSATSASTANYDNVNSVQNESISSNKPLNELKKNEERTPQGQRYAVDKLLNGIRAKMGTNIAKDSVPKWKTNTAALSLVSINSRTSLILSSIISADNIASRLKRLEELNTHVKKYPECKNYSVKIGVLRILLSLRREISDLSIQEVINETLALLGYCDPPHSSGIRVLSIDGGGMRGIAVIKMLEKLEDLSGKKIYELFDYICGVSTGAIITCCLVPPLQLSMKKLHDLYMELSQKVFKQNTLWGTSKLVFSRAYYETSVWETLLKQYVGSTSLIETNRHRNCPKICALSTVVNHLRVTPFLFRNYSLPYLRTSDYQGSSHYTMFEAVRASAAAPTIFEEFRTGDLLHQDGGISVNNPAAVAIHEVKSLWPDEKISCIVSCGTGRHNPVPTIQNLEDASKSSSSWKQIFDKILDSATDTEAVHTMLNDLLPEDVYYRFNPHLTESVSMDEIREDKISILEEGTVMYCRRNEDKFITVVNKLMEPRSKVDICRDFVRMKIKLSGYTI